ncbi:NERD domain-containing protein [Nocardia sp. NPDC049190]|uniref:nuclease-related domain-containing protein n=1 Tax=Nocardia sp. NPDC049190 TaxID=3155650 RepID=UPI0033DF7E81
MLVISERTTAPRSEQRVLGWMRSWTGQYVIVGVAISGCFLSDRFGEGEVREADLVVITPRAAVVVEVHGTVAEATAGVLSVQADGRWRLSEFDGDPIQVRDTDGSPFDQVMNNVATLTELVREHHADAIVDGLIVVVPPRESTLTLNIQSRRRGCAVVLGSTPVDLRAWFHRTASRKLVWTAERVHALLGDLDLADEVTIEDLVADGFPAEQRRHSGTRSAAGAARETPPEDGASIAEVSRAIGSSADPDAPVSHFTPGQPDLMPIAPRFSPFAPRRPIEFDDVPDEDDSAAWASDRPVLPPAAKLAQKHFAEPEFYAPESAEPEFYAVEPAKPGFYAPEPAEPDFYAPESAAPEPAAPDPLSSGAAIDPAAPTMSSAFTDQWSSWIESDGARPLRTRPALSPPPNRRPWWSDEDAEQRPPQRPAARTIVERRPRLSDLRRLSAVLARSPGRTTGSPKPATHRAQQLGAVASIAVIIGAIWLLSAACSTPHGDSGEQRPLPVSTTEDAAPPPIVTETPAQLNLLPLCLPFRSDC